MEINVRRMMDYNGYNISVISMLKQENVIGTKTAEKMLKALAVIQEAYEHVHTMTITDGDNTTQIIGSGDNEERLPE